MWAFPKFEERNEMAGASALRPRVENTEQDAHARAQFVKRPSVSGMVWHVDW
jgi:hypothetical protein